MTPPAHSPAPAAPDAEAASVAGMEAAAGQSAPQADGAAGPQVQTARTSGVLGRLVLLAVVVLLIGQTVVAWFAVDGFESELEPQLGRKAEVVGRAVADQIAFAVDDLEIPPGNLVGMDAFLGKILASNPDIEYLVILDDSSQVLFADGLPPETLERVLPGLPGPGVEAGTMTEVAGFTDGAFPIASRGGAAGERAAVLHVGVSREYVRGRLSEIFYEAMTVIVVSLLVMLEFLVFFMNVRISGPLERLEGMLADGARGVFANRLVLRARDEIGDLVVAFNRTLRSLCQRYEDFRFDAREIEEAQIDKGIARRIQAACTQVDRRYHFTNGMELRPRNAMQIRIPLFLFMFAEELPRSFLPLFVARLSPTDATVSDELLIGLPITLFMLAAAVMTPFGGGIADRFGARRVFLMGIVPAAIGYVGTFLAQSYYDLVAWRLLSGAGYGLIFIAAQAWVAEHTGEHNRAQGMTVFVGGVFAATICGPSIGGILAGRIGFEATFLISAGLAVASGLIVYFMLEGVGKGRNPRREGLFEGGQWRALVSDGRLFAVTVLAAVPGKLILSGFLFYLVPLYLSELGNRPAVIGWMIMLYGVSTILCMPFASRLADRSGRHAAVVAVGGALAGLGCLASLFEGAVGGVSNAVGVAIVALGVGHALSLTSQLAIVQEAAVRHPDGLGQASAISAYRLVERAGMVLGPIVAGALAASFGYQGAIVGIGVIVLVSIALYMLVMNLSRNAFTVKRSEIA